MSDRHAHLRGLHRENFNSGGQVKSTKVAYESNKDRFKSFAKDMADAWAASEDTDNVVWKEMLSDEDFKWLTPPHMALWIKHMATFKEKGGLGLLSATIRNYKSSLSYVLNGILGDKACGIRLPRPATRDEMMHPHSDPQHQQDSRTV